MSDELAMVSLMLIFVSISWLGIMSMTSDTDAMEVPECITPGFLTLTSESDEQSFGTMLALHQKGWENVTRQQHFWTDTITASCHGGHQ